MGQADELVVVLRVGTQAADADRHAALTHPVQPGLGAVGLLKVVQELLGSGGQGQLLGPAGKLCPKRFDLFLRGLILEAENFMILSIRQMIS